MQAMLENGLMVAVFNLGGGEIILLLALLLILLGAKKLPDLARGLGRGIFEFRKATKDAAKELDDEASQAGRSLGGIYGKPAAEALTPDNQVAEVYDPAAFGKKTKWRKIRNGVSGFSKALWDWVYRFVRRLLDRRRGKSGQ
jgi:sec-independent protein translocase protein TatA